MIDTDRLTLRPPSKPDFPEMAEMFADDMVMRHIGGKPLNRADAWARFLRDVGHWAIEEFGLFSVIEKTSGHYVGKVGYAIFERYLGTQAKTKIEMSWTLRSQFHGRGYASEAATAAQLWFDDKLKRQTACLIALDNKPSLKLATHLGYAEIDQLVRPKGQAVVMIRKP